MSLLNSNVNLFNLRAFVIYVSTILVFTAVIGLTVFSSNSASASNKRIKVSVELVPFIYSVFDKHPQFGKIITHHQLVDWAKGKRYTATTEKGRFVFFFINENMVRIYFKDKITGESSEIWSKE